MPAIEPRPPRPRRPSGDKKERACFSPFSGGIHATSDDLFRPATWRTRLSLKPPFVTPSALGRAVRAGFLPFAPFDRSPHVSHSTLDAALVPVLGAAAGQGAEGPGSP
ncbi:hypothetical protein Ddc_23938 [Ditylenchus destructor]|nr:hypothetical protein Ddc_23938 [Ditylenchus destructor]